MDHRSPFSPYDVRPFRGPRRSLCLLTTLRPERGLSHALLQHLAAEMPGIAFTLTPTDDVAAIWVCGFEPGSGEVIARHRARHPRAVILVTARGSGGTWEEEALEAGADHALPWPTAYGRLERLLGRRRAGQGEQPEEPRAGEARVAGW